MWLGSEAAGCYWFLDIIGSYQTDKRLDPNFQIWELKVNLEDNSAVAHGYNDTNKLIITQEIPYIILHSCEKWRNIGGSEKKSEVWNFFCQPRSPLLYYVL